MVLLVLSSLSIPILDERHAISVAVLAHTSSNGVVSNHFKRNADDCNGDGQISFEEYVAWLYPTSPDNKAGGSSFVYSPDFQCI